MKKVSQFSSKVEATIAAEALSERGIRAEVVGSRDYSSLIAGTDVGVFSLLVEEERVTDAENLLRSSNVNLVEPHSEGIEVSPSSYLKRAVVYALVGMAMVPVLANFISLKNLKLYLQCNIGPGKKILVTLVVLLLQIPAILTLYFFFHSVIEKFL